MLEMPLQCIICAMERQPFVEHMIFACKNVDDIPAFRDEHVQPEDLKKLRSLIAHVKLARIKVRMSIMQSLFAPCSPA